MTDLCGRLTYIFHLLKVVVVSLNIGKVFPTFVEAETLRLVSV